MHVRLLTKVQVDLLDSTRLHDFARQKCRRKVNAATASVAELFQAESVAYFDAVVRVLCEKLRLIEKLDREIKREVSLGAASIDTELYEALAAWLIERKLRGGTPLLWGDDDPSASASGPWWKVW